MLQMKKNTNSFSLDENSDETYAVTPVSNDIGDTEFETEAATAKSLERKQRFNANLEPWKSFALSLKSDSRSSGGGGGGGILKTGGLPTRRHSRHFNNVVSIMFFVF